MQLKVLAIAALAVIVVVSALFATYTFWLTPYSVAQDRTIGAGVTASGNMPRGIEAVAINTPGAPFSAVNPLSPVIRITPTGKLPSAIMLRFKLSRQSHENEAVLVGTSETKQGSWTLVPSSLSKDGWYVTVQTNHLSWWQVYWYDVNDGLNYFKKVMIDGLSGDATTEAERPSCNKDDEVAARQDNYTITSSAKNTLYWCFNLEGGVRVLKVVNHMRYPLEVAHPGFLVKHIARPNLELDQLARLGSGNDSILYPFDEAEYTVKLAPGQKAILSTEYSGLAQSLYQLETGVVALVNTLTLFGLADEGIAEVALDGNKFAKILQLSDEFLLAKDCTDAVTSFNLGQVIAKCLSPKQIIEDFGWQGLFLVPLVVLGPFVEFFRSEFDSFVGLLKNQDKYKITVSQLASPCLPNAGVCIGIHLGDVDGDGNPDQVGVTYIPATCGDLSCTPTNLGIHVVLATGQRVDYLAPICVEVGSGCLPLSDPRFLGLSDLDGNGTDEIVLTLTGCVDGCGYWAFELRAGQIELMPFYGGAASQYGQDGLAGQGARMFKCTISNGVHTVTILPGFQDPMPQEAEVYQSDGNGGMRYTSEFSVAPSDAVVEGFGVNCPGLSLTS